ncbi:hypothetical protein WJX72_000453 [[Myrmecia] bisecta]|uniref:Uncharacterized protein n=1 Tax=[Myrmecia] bisecta TaxID=41462 RepID=A0AAW1QNQ1_9CHLO
MREMTRVECTVRLEVKVKGAAKPTTDEQRRQLYRSAIDARPDEANPSSADQRHRVISGFLFPGDDPAGIVLPQE